MIAKPALIVLDPAALALARRLAGALSGEVYRYGPRFPALPPAAGEVDFADLGAALGDLFRAGRPIIGLCAAGILIRLLAPELDDKRQEAPVLALARDGSAVIPLLGGHRGANDLARKIADLCGAFPALTTASEIAFGAALDDPPAGWVLANPEGAKAAAAHLIAGGAVAIANETTAIPDFLAGLKEDETAPHRIRISIRASAAANLPPSDLLYHPRLLALGLGCEKGVPESEMLDFAMSELAAADLAPSAIAGVFSVDLKSAEPAIAAVAEKLGAPLRFFAPAELERETPRLANPSDLVFREIGCHGVAEAAALAAAGAKGRLLLPKRRGRRVTLAVAIAPSPIEAEGIGRARGRLAILGIGPGRADWRLPAVDRALDAAEDVVGYKLYLDLLGARIAGKNLHGRDLGEEIDRCRLALDLAASGRSVALVCSGDAGIYAMASLVQELIDRGNRPDWRRVAIETLPGITAMQAAAAQAGAPLGHDFCAISLSDLLTPWPEIAQRIEAAAAADFVIAFYNPISARRRRPFAEACAILRRHRPPETPVLLARQLGRAEESLTFLTLAELQPEMVDMLTLVMIGARSTRHFRRADGGHSLYTPRGYAQKRELAS